MDTQAVVAIFVLTGTIIVTSGSLYLGIREGNRIARRTESQAAAVNDAINHAHPTQPRAYDRLIELGKRSDQHSDMLKLLVTAHQEHTEAFARVEQCLARCPLKPEDDGD